MQLRTFLSLVEGGHKANYFIVAPDQLGLQMLLPRAFAKVVATEDTHFYEASTITKEKARQIEKEARKAPSGSSDYSYFVISGLQNLNSQSVGPLLKAVEEAKYSVFFFQAQWIPRYCRTLLSRSILVKLPFLSKKLVLANLQALHHDAKTADEQGLYDGTLAGTIRSLAMKDTMASIRRDMRMGVRGLPSTQSEDVVGSLAFDAAVLPLLTESEHTFLKRDSSPDRRRLAMFLACERGVAK